MDKEQVREIIMIARDLQMALSLKEQIDSGEQRGLANFADGEKISIPIPVATKNQLNAKIQSLSTLLKGRIASLS